MKNRTENISVRYRPQHLTKSQKIQYKSTKRRSLKPRLFVLLFKIKKHCNKLQCLRYKWCGRRDLNPHGYPPDPKSGASANSATPASATVISSRYLYIIS